MQQSVGMVLAAQVSPSARAGAQLGGGDGIGAVVGVEADDASVFDVGDEQAASAAVVGGAADADFGSWELGIGN